MKKIFFVFFLILVSGKIFAEDTYFDFYPNHPFIESGSEFEVTFKHELEGFGEKDFLVSSVVDRGIVKQRGGEFSINYPLSVTGFGKIDLSFDIWNLKTGEIHKTPIRTVWSTLVYSKYIERLNSNLRSFTDDKMRE
ncbi:hypothetical protein ACFLZ4_02290 [Patescibacteria group bacterium]